MIFRVIVSLSFLLHVTASPVLACDFSNDIQKVGDKYQYSVECHKEVGKRLDELEIRKEQVKELNKSIELKDLALTLEQQRVDRWMDTTIKLEDRVNTIDKLRERNKLLYIGLGVVMTGLSVWAAGQLK